MPNGGRLTIDTRSRTSMNNSPKLIRGSQHGTFVRVVVSDTGTGMDQHTLQNCFDLFFSTKQDAAAGLGLPTAHAIIRRNGGYIDVRSSSVEGPKSVSICLQARLSQ
jgi:two-component system cell cycle sensor histidine kinase/response regulator CckA